MQKTTYHAKWSEDKDLEREQISRCFGPGGQGKGRQGTGYDGCKGPFQSEGNEPCATLHVHEHHGNAHLKQVHFMVCKLYLKETAHMCKNTT